jgi:RND superfamily putative drug exporter
VLTRLARAAIRWRWPVAGSWVVLLVAALHFLPSLASVVTNDNAAFLPPGAASVRAEQLVAGMSAPGQQGGVLVAASSTGPLDPAQLSAVATIEAKVRRLPAVASVGGGVTSADGSVRTLSVAFTREAAGGGTAGRRAVEQIRALFPAVPGCSFYLTGSLPVLVDQQQAASRTESNLVLATALLVLVLLLITLRSLGAPLVVLAASALSLGISGPVIAWSTHIGVQISSLLELLLTALVFGAGTDYGLFLVFRYREALSEDLDPEAAIVEAMARVGESITFSAATVIAALLSLLLAGFGLYRGVGPGLAIGIGVVLLVNLTFLPAALAICGRRVFWPWRSRLRPQRGWGTVASRTTSRPLGVLLAGVVLLGVLAGFLVAYAPSGFEPGGAIGGSNSALGEQVIEEHFGALELAGTEVAFRLARPVWGDPSQITAIRADLLRSGRFTAVSDALNDGGVSVPSWWLSLAHRFLGPPQGLSPTAPPGLGTYSAWYDAYRSTAEVISADGRTVVFKAALAAGDPSSTAAMQDVPAIRAATARVAADVGALESGDIGTAPAAFDVSAVSTADMAKVVPVVLFLLALLLALLVRSLVAPLYLVASVGLSYLAALGLTVAIFVVAGHGLGVNFTLPFFMFVFVMALGQDYNILVMARIKEEAARRPLRRAVSVAMAATGTTVTSAGLILAGTFGVVAWTTSGQVRQIGVGLALGILLDTFLVRTLLLPSTVVLLGRLNWWPQRAPLLSLPAAGSGATAEPVPGEAGQDRPRTCSNAEAMTR